MSSSRPRQHWRPQSTLPWAFQRGLWIHLSTLLLPGDITQVIAQSSRTVPPEYCLVALGNLENFSTQTGRPSYPEEVVKVGRSQGGLLLMPQREIQAAIHMSD